MGDDFWGSPRTGGHRKPDADPSFWKAFLRGPESLSRPVWYTTLGAGAFVALVALWGLGAALLAWLG